VVADERPTDQRAHGRPVGDVVRCSHDLKVVPDTSWDDLGEIDLLVLPGGDTRPLQADEAFLERMRQRAEAGTLMTSVCTGALVYGKAGLLADRPATTHWSALDRLADLGAKVDREARFVDDGNIVTAAGVSAGIDMALHLVARLESVERAQEVRRYIQYDPQPLV
jgi:Transcriptional regulator containing an amidase domain and an AraC-type DNA-binding HTH domain